MEPGEPPKDPDPNPPGFPPTPEPNPDEPGPDLYPVVDPDDPAPQRLRASRFMLVASTALIAVLLPACQSQQHRDAERERAQRDANSAAYKAGEAARRLATEAEKATATAARKLDESARKAREGWREQERNDKERRGRVPADH